MFNEMYYDERDAAQEAIARIIWNDPGLNRIELNWGCKFRGMIYGSKKYKDGVEITTNYIEAIERTERHFKNDTMCVITRTGERFYFNSDDCKAYVLFMFDDYIDLRRK